MNVRARGALLERTRPSWTCRSSSPVTVGLRARFASARCFRELAESTPCECASTLCLTCLIRLLVWIVRPPAPCGFYLALAVAFAPPPLPHARTCENMRQHAKHDQTAHHDLQTHWVRKQAIWATSSCGMRADARDAQGT